MLEVVTLILMWLATILNLIGLGLNLRSWRRNQERNKLLLRENLELRLELRKYKEKEKER